MILLHRLLILSETKHLQEKIIEISILIVLVDHVPSFNECSLAHSQLQNLIANVVEFVVDLHAIHAVNCGDSVLHAVDGDGLVGDGGHGVVLG